ncbi:hypothetical protein [Roseobacter sp. CCS2]|uniref:hypothetical protein n=1 Tax=Roseobacter sp. CCS2 TaxID=391593 RepID=UPI0012E9B4B4|nr:hypothetical protein [Roseobacter sp. CCS2]
MGQPFQVQIQQLLQAGVATHVVANSDALDPVFALSKTQDFPQVTFAAAFEDGTVVLGCKGDLLEPLVGLAQTITPVDAPVTDTTAAKLDTIVAQLQKISAAQPQDTTPTLDQDRIFVALDTQAKLGQTLQEHISDVATAVKMAQGGDAQTLPDGALAPIHAQLEQLIEATSKTPDSAQMAQELAQLRAKIAQIAPPHAAQHDSATIDSIQDTLAGLETRLMAQIAAAPPPDLTLPTDAINAAQQVTEQALTTLSNDIKALFSAHNMPDSKTVSDAYTSDLMSRLENLPALNALDEKLSVVMQDLHDLKDAPAPDAAQDQLSSQIDTLAADIAAMSRRPAPQLDLTE